MPVAARVLRYCGTVDGLAFVICVVDGGGLSIAVDAGLQSCAAGAAIMLFCVSNNFLDAGLQSCAAGAAIMLFCVSNNFLMTT
jgi:hypothetical protein